MWAAGKLKTVLARVARLKDCRNRNGAKLVCGWLWLQKRLKDKQASLESMKRRVTCYQAIVKALEAKLEASRFLLELDHGCCSSFSVTEQPS